MPAVQNVAVRLWGISSMWDVLDRTVGRERALLVLAAEERDLDLLPLVLVRVVLQGAEASRLPHCYAVVLVVGVAQCAAGVGSVWSRDRRQPEQGEEIICPRCRLPIRPDVDWDLGRDDLHPASSGRSIGHATARRRTSCRTRASGNARAAPRRARGR